MDEIEVVIRIPKEEYHYIQLYGGIKPFSGNFIAKQIKKGTVLPKGHGELKDISNLKYVFDLTREDPIYSGKDIERAVKTMKSIIEADKEESEGYYMSLHRDNKLDSLIGKVVEVTLYDNTILKGVLGFTEEFSAKYGYKKPGCYTCDSWSFRKTRVKEIKQAESEEV